ncbi:MAG: hypothetical protein RR415_10090 [Ruthenibacterium sp.]
MVIVNGKIFENRDIVLALKRAGMDIPETQGGYTQICVATKGPNGYIAAYESGESAYHGVCIDVVPPEDVRDGQYTCGLGLVTVENAEPDAAVEGDTAIQAFLYENLDLEEVTRKISFTHKGV